MPINGLLTRVLLFFLWDGFLKEKNAKGVLKYFSIRQKQNQKKKKSEEKQHK